MQMNQISIMEYDKISGYESKPLSPEVPYNYSW